MDLKCLLPALSATLSFRLIYKLLPNTSAQILVSSLCLTLPPLHSL
jgi:hypothetical protein